ncbi:MAG: hypothetical protein JOZ62_14970, partial [Acidobacteriaceae bacterium]|nr:hypothetical protein [Acidobacteriaceae bacterium]
LFNVAAELHARFPGFVGSQQHLARLATLSLVLVAVALLNRDRKTLKEIPGGAQAIYDQQYQMARFLATYYPNAPIAANDIGAITFYGNHDCLDLVGLATVEVADLRAKNAFTTDQIQRLAEEHRTRVAVVYPSWFVGTQKLPSDWLQVGTWRLNPYERGFLGDTYVAFYAVHPQETEYLARSLRAFESRVPPNVQQSGLYLKSQTLTARVNE